MPTPPKSVDIIKFEKKSHRTKKEYEHREKAEKELYTGEAMREKDKVKSDPVAHKEFMRLRRLFAKIGKDDGLHENIINRYCELYAESFELVERKNAIVGMLDELDERGGEMDFTESLRNRLRLYEQIGAAERQLHAKREMLLKIEKECLMTTAAAMRAIPKQPPKADEGLETMFG